MTAANRNILIIGLHEDICEAITQRLNANNYAVHWVQSGEEALAVVRGEAFGAVLLEGIALNRPDDGRELLDSLIEVNPMLPVIILTASVALDSYKAREFMARGAFGIVSMPFDGNGLLLVIAEAMRPRTKPWTRPPMPEETARLEAGGMIRYFERVHAKFPKYKFKLGANTAREWMRLAEQGPVSASEVAALVATVTQGRWWGTGWLGLARGVSDWARSLGFPGVDFKVVSECLPDEPTESDANALKN